MTIIIPPLDIKEDPAGRIRIESPTTVEDNMEGSRGISLSPIAVKEEMDAGVSIILDDSEDFCY